MLPLDGAKLQCTSCHDPHLNETDPEKQPGKFLRANRLQESAPGGGAFNPGNDQVCLGCHDKAGLSWAQVGAKDGSHVHHQWFVLARVEVSGLVIELVSRLAGIGVYQGQLFQRA